MRMILSANYREEPAILAIPQRGNAILAHIASDVKRRSKIVSTLELKRKLFSLLLNIGHADIH
jgi:hypothetical protein